MGGMGMRGADRPDEVPPREFEFEEIGDEESQPAAPQLKHTLVVEEPAEDQAFSSCSISPSKAEQLGLMAGDVVRLKGSRHHETLCIIQESKQACTFSFSLP